MTIVVDAKTPYAEEVFGRLGNVRVLTTAHITRNNLRDADAVIVRSETKVHAGLLDGTRVGFVGTATIGVDHVDTAYLAGRGIRFACAPGSNANSVAEYVAAALLALAVRTGISLSGTTLGVVGVGNVGRRVVAVGETLGMRVIKNDPPLARETGDPGFRPLPEILEADVVTLHVPLTREGPDPTYHLFDQSLFRAHRRGAILINTARGAVVEGEALGQALASGHLRSAVLDVWEREPDIDVGLLEHVAVGTAHIAGYSFDGKMNAARMMFEALNNHLGAELRWQDPRIVPPPVHPVVTLHEATGMTEGVLHKIVAHAYDILQDDASLRTMAGLPAGQRAAEFRRLRAEYRVRREFSATRVELPRDAEALKAVCRNLGFRTG
jgi:erythronate-4-phosphate dehydrogenase